MNRFWVIGNSKKGTFSRKKSVFIFLLSYFCNTCILKTENILLLLKPVPFLNRWYLINGSFLSRVTFHMVNVKKSCTLIVILVKCLYLTSPMFNSSVKVKPYYFICRGGSTYIYRSWESNFSKKWEAIVCRYSTDLTVYLLKQYEEWYKTRMLKVNNLTIVLVVEHDLQSSNSQIYI